MSESGGNLEPRVEALEGRVDNLAEQLRQTKRDAVAARVLAGGADRDVEQVRGEIRDFRRATASSFNAMRDDLTDLRTQVNAGFAEIRGRLDATAAGLTQITHLLTTMMGEGGAATPG